MNKPLSIFLVLLTAFLVFLLMSCEVATDLDDDNDADNTDEDIPLEPIIKDSMNALTNAVDYLLSTQYSDGYWMGSFVTDTSFTADYILLMHYVGKINQPRQEKAVKYILDEQQSDGGWNTYPEGPSVLYVSVIDYLALKLAGIPSDDPAMLKARDFILANGGAESVNTLCKTKIACFGQVPWRSMISLNTGIMALKDIVYKIGYFHSVLIPFTLIYENYYVVHPPAGHGIEEIFLTDPWEGINEKPPKKGGYADEVIDWVLKRQENDGNWAGVFINTSFSLMALKSTGDPAFDEIIDEGMKGVELFQNEDDDTINQQFSQPPVMDTAYVLHVLLAAGIESDHPAVKNAVDWLLSKQTTIYGDWKIQNPEGMPGGWSFEHFNQYYPDVDCTVMVLDTFSLMDQSTQDQLWDAMQRGIQWAVTMQNDDGGWAAWDKNTIDPAVILPWLADELWLPSDLSYVDITARTILALVNLGYPGKYGDPTVIEQGITFLKERQKAKGYWYGRWGTNYTYGTGQVLQALVTAGEDPSEEYIQRAVKWLKSIQNADGGWGESPESYLDESYAGVGDSTIFQTAYVLIGLISTGETYSQEVKNGIQYLIDQALPNGGWYDENFLGTNLPGYWYSRYDMLSTYKAAYALAMFIKNFEAKID